MSGFQHSIKSVASRTGLSPHVIRIWEKRYGAVRPDRSETRRRMYNELEVERLKLLGQATAAGYAIGTIAGLPTEEIIKLLKQHDQSHPTKPAESTSDLIIAEAIKAVKGMDNSTLEELLGKAVVTLGTHGLLEKVIGPLAEKVGDLWRDGTISAAHEHFLSASIRTYLGSSVRPYSVNSSAPVLVVATPSNQLHELGAIIVSAAASDLGWRVVYLGVGLPPGDIAGAAVQNKARAVALSIVYPEDDPRLGEELAALRRILPPQIYVLVGGRAAGGYRDAISRMGAVQPATLGDLYKTLDSFRHQS